MKITFVNIFLFFAFSQANAQTAGEVVDSFFEALNSKNHELLNELCLDDMKIHTLAIGEEIEVSSQSKQEFVDGIKSIPNETKIFEKIRSEESIVNEHLAQYMLPYSFYVDDKLSHSGTNVMTLLKTKEGWKISYIADTRKKS
ncbi:DUF4829 domain-containing protein [Psychroflexus salinarum]|uniref:DUF4829 domain-containing protein n=1 Tax=Psychroflexus salinarum TaxID=546024 RepID=A0ABW3GL24_9FLAO